MGSRRTSGGTKHLRFEKIDPEKGKKMPRYLVWNIEFNQMIGVIHWRGGWRQYVFCSQPGVDESRSCAKEWIAFIDKLMAKWYEARRKKS